MEATFLIGKYDEKALTKQLCQALSFVNAAAAGEDPEKKAKKDQRGRIFAALMAVAVGAALLYLGLHAGGQSAYVLAAVLLFILGGYMLVTSRDAGWMRESKTAKALFKSLNGIESSQKPAVRFTDEKMLILSRASQAEVSYQEIQAAADTEALIVLRHGRAATVLQKKELVGKELPAVEAFLRSHLDCPFYQL